MATVTDNDTRSTDYHAHDAEYGAVNESGMYLFLVAVVAMLVALPLAILV